MNQENLSQLSREELVKIVVEQAIAAKQLKTELTALQQKNLGLNAIISISKEITSLSEDEVKEKLIEVYKQMLLMENNYKNKIKESWGIS